MARIDGTNRAERIDGTPGDDRISGKDGNDVLYGNQGDDELFGDAGNDKLDGQKGENDLHGGQGNDTIQAFNDHGNGPKTDENWEFDYAWGDKGNDIFKVANNGDMIAIDFQEGDKLYFDGLKFSEVDSNKDGFLTIEDEMVGYQLFDDGFDEDSHEIYNPETGSYFVYDFGRMDGPHGTIGRDDWLS